MIFWNSVGRQKYTKSKNARTDKYTHSWKITRNNSGFNFFVKKNLWKFSDIKNYYNDITLNNLALINSLKEQIEEMKKKEDRLGKAMAEVMVRFQIKFSMTAKIFQSQNRKLTEPLEKAREINEELRRQLANYEKDKRFIFALTYFF